MTKEEFIKIIKQKEESTREVKFNCQVYFLKNYPVTINKGGLREMFIQRIPTQTMLDIPNLVDTGDESLINLNFKWLQENVTEIEKFK